MKTSTKALLVIGILGIGGYLYWKSTKSSKAFANLGGKCNTCSSK